MRLFWTKGFDGTSISDLTRVMGIGSPSLYAAFASKEALYAEALRHYVEQNDHLAWSGFEAAKTARDAAMSLLMDSAAALTGSLEDNPLGCMVTLSSVDSEEHPGLASLVREVRAAMFDRLLKRFSQGERDGELASSLDAKDLARYVQVVQSGMSVLARDGISRRDLESVAQVAMLGWDARTAKA